MIFFERKISLFIFVTQDVKNNIPICICRICLLRIIFKFVFIHQKKYSLQSGWKKVTVWTSDGRRCWTECQMEWGAGLNVWLREVTVWKLDGSRCWTEGRMEGGAGLKVWLKEVTVWKSDWRRWRFENRMEGGAGLKVRWISCIPSG